MPLRLQLYNILLRSVFGKKVTLSVGSVAYHVFSTELSKLSSDGAASSVIPRLISISSAFNNS